MLSLSTHGSGEASGVKKNPKHALPAVIIPAGFLHAVCQKSSSYMFIIFDIISFLSICAVIFCALKSPHLEVGGIGGVVIVASGSLWAPHCEER